MINQDETLDICVITYNRLAYLKNCVWSIIAATKVKNRIIVIDDASNDGTGDWLKEMKSLGKIDDFIINEKNIGSPKTINKIIKKTTSRIVAVISDDIWIHRGWDIKSIETFKKYNDCGMVSFWNFPIENYPKSERVDPHTIKHQQIGVAALILSRELFDEVGGYQLPDGIKMGYFSKIFCKSALSTKLKRKHQYLLYNPFYAEQMDRNNPGTDLPLPKLNQEHLYKEYNKRRADEKLKHKGVIK